MFDYEWAATQHNVNCRLANRVLVPEAIPPERLARYGARGDKLIRYPGLKEEYYLSDFEPDRGVLAQLGVEAAEVLNVVRTAPSYALYLGGSETPLLARVLRRAAADERVHTVVLARTDEQRADVRALGLERVVVPDAHRRRPQSRRARRRARLGRRHDEPRGGRARHAGLVDVRGPAGRRRRAARARGPPAAARGRGAIAFEPKPPGRSPTACAATRAPCWSSRCPGHGDRVIAAALLAAGAVALAPGPNSASPPSRRRSAPPRRAS